MPRKPPPIQKPTPPIDRFRQRVIVTDGCWHWTGAPNERGYGAIAIAPQYPGDKRRTLYVHRFSYTTFVGPIPEGMQLDHQCASDRDRARRALTRLSRQGKAA